MIAGESSARAANVSGLAATSQYSLWLFCLPATAAFAAADPPHLINRLLPQVPAHVGQELNDSRSATAMQYPLQLTQMRAAS